MNVNEAGRRLHPTSRKFNVKFSDATYDAIDGVRARLEEATGRPVTLADVIREGVHLYAWAAAEVEAGSEVLVRRAEAAASVSVEVPSLEPLRPPDQAKVVVAAPPDRRRGAPHRHRPAPGDGPVDSRSGGGVRC